MKSAQTLQQEYHKFLELMKREDEEASYHAAEAESYRRKAVIAGRAMMMAREREQRQYVDRKEGAR